MVLLKQRLFPRLWELMNFPTLVENRKVFWPSQDRLHIRYYVDRVSRQTSICCWHFKPCLDLHRTVLVLAHCWASCTVMCFEGQFLYPHSLYAVCSVILLHRGLRWGAQGWCRVRSPQRDLSSALQTALFIHCHFDFSIHDWLFWFAANSRICQ